MADSKTQTKFKLITADNSDDIDTAVNKWIARERPATIKSWQYVKVAQRHDRVLVEYEESPDEDDLEEWISPPTVSPAK